MFQAKLLILVLFHFCSSSPQWRPDSRIIGGERVAAHDLKSMVAIYVNHNDPHDPDAGEECGGTLIEDDVVLTAAHCVDGTKTIDMMVFGADNIQRENEDGRVYRRAKSFVKHESYSRQTRANDIALVKLNQTITGATYVAKATLEQKTTDTRSIINKTATAFGWGLQNRRREATNLYKVSARIATCALGYQGAFCTSGEGNKGTCVGDSGGPAFLDGVQIGVISRGLSQDCERSAPSVYTRVGYFRDWIDRKKALLRSL